MSRTFAALAAIALFGGSAAAAGYGFTAEFTGDATPPIGAINISVNPDIVGVERLSTSSMRDALVHPRDAEQLIDELRDELEGDLSRTGAYAPMVAAPVATLNVEIVRATPTRPAMTENGRRRNLHFSSVSVGGAEIKADLIGPDGAAIGHFEYRWDDDAINQGIAIGEWSGADRAFSRFAARLADELDSHVADAAGALSVDPQS